MRSLSLETGKLFPYPEIGSTNRVYVLESHKFEIQLKCSDEQKGESCMNCVIYGTKCQYTPPWSPNSGRKKDSASKIAGVKKRSSNRNSTSPVALDSQDSPTSSYNEDMFLTDQNMLPKMAQARRLAAGTICAILGAVSNTDSNKLLIKNLQKPQIRTQISIK
jgi:hypothetical protein